VKYYGIDLHVKTPENALLAMVGISHDTVYKARAGPFAVGVQV
jgi:hypothetical protein